MRSARQFYSYNNVESSGVREVSGVCFCLLRNARGRPAAVARKCFCYRPTAMRWRVLGAMTTDYLSHR